MPTTQPYRSPDTPAPAAETTTSLLDQVLEQPATRPGITAGCAAFLGVEPEKVCNLLRNVWPTGKGEANLSDAEMFMGMSMIARYGLDPVAREVTVTRDKQGRLMTIVRIDGFVKILDRTPHYDGFEWNYKWNDDETHLIWVEAIIHSKTRSVSTSYRALAWEYAVLAGFMGKKIPEHMLRLFALRHATRLFTPLGNSVVTEEEARWMNEAGNASDTVEADAALTGAAQPEPDPSADPRAAEQEPQPEAPPEAAQGEPEPAFNPPSEEEADAASEQDRVFGEYSEEIASAMSASKLAHLRADVERDDTLRPGQKADLIEAIAKKKVK